MQIEEIMEMQDKVIQIWSFSRVGKSYADEHYETDELLHIGVILDKVCDLSEELKNQFDQVSCCNK